MKLLKGLLFIILIFLLCFGLLNIPKLMGKTMSDSFVELGEASEKYGLTELGHKNIKATVSSITKYTEFGYRLAINHTDVEFEGDDGEKYLLNSIMGTLLYNKADRLYEKEVVQLEVSFGQVINISTD